MKKQVTMNESKCGDCAFSYNGICRRFSKEVGYFENACDDYRKPMEPLTLQSDNPTLPKVCKTCGRELPLSAFGRLYRTVDGLQPSCRECMREKVNRGSREMWAKKKGEPEEKEKIDLEIEEILDKPEPLALNKPLAEYTAQEIFDELKRRGFSGRLARTDVLE